MPNMKMGPVTNPANNDKMKVQANATVPPPVTPITDPRDVGEGEAINSNDLILAEAGASASVLNADNNDAVIVEVDGLVIDINPEEVTVPPDEYYCPETGLTDTWLTIGEDYLYIRG
jgi:hypothetical protein